MQSVNMTSFQAIRADEFAAADYQVRYIIEGLLVEGQPTLLGGPKKSLKTSLALAMALSVASGRPFLGQFKVPNRRRVLFCSGESALAELRVRHVGSAALCASTLASFWDSAFAPPCQTWATSIACAPLPD
jgi:RecA-family ATPase